MHKLSQETLSVEYWHKSKKSSKNIVEDEL